MAMEVTMRAAYNVGGTCAKNKGATVLGFGALKGILPLLCLQITHHPKSHDLIHSQCKKLGKGQKWQPFHLKCLC